MKDLKNSQLPLNLNKLSRDVTMKTLYTILTIAVIGGTLYFLPEEPEATEVKVADTTVQTEEEITKPTKAVVSQKAEPKKEAKAFKSAKGKYNIKEPVEYTDVFEDADMEEMKTKVKTKPKVEPLLAYKMKKDSIKNLAVGDTIVLPEIDGMQHTLKVEARKTNPNGSVTARANIEGADAEYYAIMTEGAKTSFITLNTSEGVYEFETINGNGYVYSGTDMHNNMNDFSKSDAVVPSTIKPTN